MFECKNMTGTNIVIYFDIYNVSVKVTTCKLFGLKYWNVIYQASGFEVPIEHALSGAPGTIIAYATTGSKLRIRSSNKRRYFVGLVSLESDCGEVEVVCYHGQGGNPTVV